MMPEIDGFGFLGELHNRKISSAVIMTTGFSTVENAVKSLYSGAIDFIPKPFTSDELINSVLRGMRYIQIQNSRLEATSEMIRKYLTFPVLQNITGLVIQAGWQKKIRAQF